MTKNFIATVCCAFLMTAPTYLISEQDDAFLPKETSPIVSACQSRGAPSLNNKPIPQTERVFSKQKQQDISPFKFSAGGQYSRVRQFSHNMPTYRGNLGGMFAEFEYKKRNSVYADATALWNWGSLHAHDNPKATVAEGVWEGDLGGSYSWGKCNRWTITAFTGFGYRRYINDFAATESVTAIKIEYQNYFVPVGFKLNFDFSANWRASLNAKVLPSVDEKLYVYTAKGSYWKQARKPSYSADLPITWSTPVLDTCFLEITATPFFRFWQLGSAHVLGFPTWKQVYWGGQGTVGLNF